MLVGVPSGLLLLLPLFFVPGKTDDGRFQLRNLLFARRYSVFEPFNLDCELIHFNLQFFNDYALFVPLVTKCASGDESDDEKQVFHGR